jgi:Na+/proline symporter
MGISTLDTRVVGIYAVSIFALAQWVSRERGEHRKNAQDYFLASRALPWWAIGTSLIAAAVLSFALREWWPALPFIDRVGLVFLICMTLAVIVSLLQKPQPPSLTIELKNLDYSTSAGFNFAAVVIVAVLIVLYATWW